MASLTLECEIPVSLAWLQLVAASERSEIGSARTWVGASRKPSAPPFCHRTAPRTPADRAPPPPRPPHPHPHPQAGTSPGEKFNIEHEGRFFEVVVPPGSAPGETLTIVGVAAASPFNSLKDLQDAAVTKALALNSYFKIQERAATAQSKVLSTVTEIDAKYEISKMPLVVSGATIAKSYLDLALAKAKEIDASYKIQERVQEIGNRVIVYALEIDAKFAISATTARLILSTSNAVVQTYTVGQERVKQSIETVHDSVSKTAGFVQEKTQPTVDFVSKKSELVFDYVNKTKEQFFPAAAPIIAAK